MKKKKMLLCLGFFISVMLFNTNVHAAIDSSAATVLLRTSCNENGATIDNCFDDLNTLNSWIWNTRYPSPTSPLKVDAGPGTFTGSFTCNGSGFVTIAGAGMGNTVIQNGSSPVSSSQCVNLVFSDMTLKNTGTLFGVRNVGGTTVWSNIEIIGLGYAWFDTPGGCSGEPGTHYWFGSRIIAETTASGSATAYFNACDKTWFYGSEITAKGTSGLSTPLVAVGGEVHVYGSNIRAIPAEGVIMTEITAVTAANTAEIHIHGTGIDVISSAGNDITALSAENGGRIHANESSYVLKTGAGGVVTRVSNAGGNIAAPYQWQVSATPPVIDSLSGYDTVIYTSTGDGHPHFAVYDSSCAGGWYDINTSSCL